MGLTWPQYSSTWGCTCTVCAYMCGCKRGCMCDIIGPDKPAIPRTADHYNPPGLYTQQGIRYVSLHMYMYDTSGSPYTSEVELSRILPFTLLASPTVHYDVSAKCVCPSNYKALAMGSRELYPYIHLILKEMFQVLK